jgi:RecB family exonuclease
MEVRRPSLLSQSSLQDYLDCPRRFQLRYLQRLRYPAIESEPALENELRQREGNYFHRLVQQYWLGLPPEDLRRHANSEDLRAWWTSFVAADFGIETHTKYAELSLSAGLGPFRLVAKYDLVAVLPGERVLIFDWKTSRKLPSRDWLAQRQQTRVYRALMAVAGAHLDPAHKLEPKQIELVYWFPEFPQNSIRFPYDSGQARRDWDDLTALAREISSATDFPKTEDVRACRFCFYRSHCERGTDAGNVLEAEVEAEADAQESFDVDFEQVGEIAF